MADIAVDVDTLPEEIREKLAELDLELSEGKWLRFSLSPLPTITNMVSLFFVIQLS